MFHDIPPAIAGRMKELETIDAQDRIDGTLKVKRLRQIGPETGKFIAILAASAPAGKFFEIGTSGGYSTLWLALACRAAGKRISTFEINEEKAEIARRTFEMTRVNDIVELIPVNALDRLHYEKNIAFCFLDAEKEIYSNCYEVVVPRLVPGGILVADNAISQEPTLRPMLQRALNDHRVDAMIVPVGKGELVCRKK